MRHLLVFLLLACAAAAHAQVEPLLRSPFPDRDPDLMQAAPAWLVGDHLKARQHFKAAAVRGHPLGQYNFAMMLLYREGGPCDAAQALALLHKAADAGVDLAGDALAQMNRRARVSQQGQMRPFPCHLPHTARSVSPAEAIAPASAR